MRYVVLTVIEKNGHNGRAMTSSSVEVNSLEAAVEAKREIEKVNTRNFDRVTVSLFPKGALSKEEILMQLVHANPLANIKDLNDRAEEIRSYLKQ